MSHIKLLFPKEEKRDLGLVSLFHFLHDFCRKIFLLLCSINWPSRVTIGEERGGLPCLFSKIGKKCLNLGEKCPDCCHLWVKFLIQNAIFKSFQAKKSDIFSLRGPSFSSCWWMVIEMTLFQKNSSTLKTSWLRACDQILLSGCIYFLRYWGIYVV